MNNIELIEFTELVNKKILKDKIHSSALTWIDTPYHHQAKLKEVGVDCVNLIIAIGQEVGLIDHIELAPYNLQWHIHSKEEILLHNLEKHGCIKLNVDLDKPETWPSFSIIALQYGRACSHLALLLPNQQVIHAAIDFGKVVMHDLSSEFINRTRALYQYPNYETNI